MSLWGGWWAPRLFLAPPGSSHLLLAPTELLSCVVPSEHQSHRLMRLFDAAARVCRVFLWERHLIWGVVVPLQV